MLNSYFKEVNENQKNLVFIVHGTEYTFIGPNTKGVVIKSAKKIVAGLNHMFAWAYDNGKYEFMNKMNIFFVDLYNYLTADSFKDNIYIDVKENRFPNVQLATAYHYKKFINNMDIDIYNGIIEYVDNNIIENTDDEVVSLDNEDLFLITCIMTITKVMIVGVSLLERFKLENYLYEPLIVATDKFQDGMANYYYNIKQERGERYAKIRSKDFKNSIYTYFYNELTKEFERNNVGVFRNNGYSVDRIANDHYITGLCTISKGIPILVTARTSQLYTLEDDYKEYKFINKNTVKYLEGTLHNMIGDKLGTPFGGVISVIKYDRSSESDHNFYESAMKQEVVLERKSVSDMDRRRHNIKLLKEYVNDMIIKYDLLNKYPTAIMPTPLTDFFIIKLLSEISEDTLTLKLLDRKTYIGVALVIANKLKTKGWKNLGDAVLSDSLTPSDVAKFLGDKMDRITRLRKYHTNPTNALEDIQKICGYDYKNTITGTMLHITSDFVQFLLNDQIDKFIFIDDAYIYDYEPAVRKADKEKEELKHG